MLAYLLLTGGLLLPKHPSLAQINPDGFNIYKDLLRTKSDDPYSFFDPNDAYQSYHSYLYRGAPSVLVLPNDSADLNKRGVNHFKSMMLIPPRDDDVVGAEQIEPNKEDEQVYHFPRVVVKRATSAHLSAASPISATPCDAARSSNSFNLLSSEKAHHKSLKPKS